MKPLLFMHAHKTGGTAFHNAVLKPNFDPAEICPANTDSSLTHVEDVSRYRLFSGHISVPGLRRKITDFDVVTIVREPVARAVSAFYFWRALAERNEPYIPYMFNLLTKMTVEDFAYAQNREILDSISNAQHRLHNGGRFGFVNDLRSCVIRDVATMPDMIVGTADDLDSLARALCGRRGWKASDIPWMNETDYELPSERAAARLAAINELDTELFERHQRVRA